MKGRWIAIGAALGFALALTLGFAHVGGPSMPDAGNGQGMMGQGMVGQGMMDMGDMGAMWATMDRMHDSSAMQDMHAQMPAELRARCEGMHEQMSQMMDEGAAGGMDGMSGAMGAMPGSGSHASHHPGTPGS